MQEEVQDTRVPNPLTDPDIIHPDESTSLLPEARSLNWRQKCCKHFPVVAFLFICLLLLANVCVSIDFNVISAYRFISKIPKDTAPTPSPDSIMSADNFRPEVPSEQLPRDEPEKEGSGLTNEMDNFNVISAYRFISKISKDTAPTPSPDSIMRPDNFRPEVPSEQLPRDEPEKEGSGLSNEMDDIYGECICLQVLDTLTCLIFLIIVARSPRFLGCFTILKNLVRLPRFWILVFLLVLYVLGTLLVINFVTHSIPDSQPRKNLYYGCLVMDFWNALIKVALVGALNQVQIRNVARSRCKYWLLKGTLVVTCIRLLCSLIGSLMTIYFYFVISIVTDVNDSRGQHKAQEGSLTVTVMEMLLLPLVITTTELIWTKILQDNKCIIGKFESNSFT